MAEGVGGAPGVFFLGGPPPRTPPGARGTRGAPPLARPVPGGPAAAHFSQGLITLPTHIVPGAWRPRH